MPAVCTADAANNRLSYSGVRTGVSGFFYRPQGAGPFPVVLVLHSRGGLGPGERSYTSWLSTQGYVALAPDYFTPVGVTSETWDGSFYARHTDQVREDLARGLDCLKSLPYVAADRIGVMGFSLGGYYSFVMGTRPDVKAAISWYGAIWGAPISRTPTRYSFSDIAAQMMAPTLILHGDADTEPPVSHAIRARDLLVSAGKEVELVIYPGVGHGWDCERCTSYVYDARATADARARTLAFFQAKLK